MGSFAYPNGKFGRFFDDTLLHFFHSGIASGFV